MKFQNILVPIDFSEFSSSVLNYAIGLAEKFHSNLILLHAVVLFEDDVNEEQRLQEYEEWVRKREKNINAHMKKNELRVNQKGISVDSVILRSISAADAILEYLNDHSCDLIIMGTHGRTGLKHIFLGSVAEKIVRLSPIPVLSVHRSVQDFRIENIIAPIDFSIYSKNAADYAISIAENFKAQVNFIHVIEKEIHPSFYASGVESIFQIDTGLQDRVIQNMQGFLEEQLNSDIKPRFMVKEGRAHREIVEYAKEEKADLIVISTHGLTGLEYLLLGSTTEKVVRWASCPVLTLKTNK
jgi:nucleotide-binding universal stress UspA family protein